MSDAPKYQNIGGNVGAMGDGARSDNNTLVVQAASAIDLGKLAVELGQVRAAMKKQGDPDNPSQDEEIGTIAQAEKAAKSGDKSKALEILKGAGTWTLEVAKSVAAGLVKDAIEGKIGT
ncbi:hypothetical protein [Bradyrhizobium sp. P5_C12]